MMIVKKCVSLSMAFLAAACASPDEGGADLEKQGNFIADTVIVNGQVMTPSGWAEAIAINDGVVTHVGTNEEISDLADDSTTVYDAHGGAVLPGLHDLHVHSIPGGLEQSSCMFRPAATPKEIQAAVTECVGRVEPGEWIRGGNWIGNVFADGQQTKEFLDEVAPDNPVMLSDESHHSTWANSAALQAAGIARDTPDPVNGKIERDANGEPTGVLREAASGLLFSVVPPYTDEQMKKGLQIASDLMLSYGVTSFSDAGLDRPSTSIISEMSKSGEMKLRVRGCMRWNPMGAAGSDDGLRLIADRQRYATERFKPDCVKVGLDGVPTEAHTAAMLAPYAHSNEMGMSSIPADILNAAVINFDRQGLHVKFHAAGDAAVRNAINAIEAARKANGYGGKFHDVAHASFVDMAEIKRMVDLQSSWEFSPYIWYPSTITRDIVEAVGDERMKRWIPIADALKAGGLAGPGSDWSVVPSINPWLAIETMITRQKPGGSAETLGVDERVSLADAMQMYTLNAARVMQHSDLVGTIEPGKLADVFVADRNPFSIPETEIHKISVRWTFIEGEKVYDSDVPPASLEGVRR